MFFHRKAKIDPLLKCSTESNYIEQWKNCTINNHVTPSYESDDHSCIIGSIDEKIVFQVSFDKKGSMAARKYKSRKLFRKH